jgi:hypothetical protein
VAQYSYYPGMSLEGLRKTTKNFRQDSQHLVNISVDQCCPTFLYIGALLTDGCGGAGAVWRLQ